MPRVLPTPRCFSPTCQPWLSATSLGTEPLPDSPEASLSCPQGTNRLWGKELPSDRRCWTGTSWALLCVTFFPWQPLSARPISCFQMSLQLPPVTAYLLWTFSFAPATGSEEDSQILGELTTQNEPAPLAVLASKGGLAPTHRTHSRVSVGKGRWGEASGRRPPLPRPS